MNATSTQSDQGPRPTSGERLVVRARQLIEETRQKLDELERLLAGVETSPLRLVMTKDLPSSNPLALALARRGMTQFELATKAGVSLATVQRVASRKGSTPTSPRCGALILGALDATSPLSADESRALFPMLGFPAPDAGDLPSSSPSDTLPPESGRHCPVTSPAADVAPAMTTMIRPSSFLTGKGGAA